ncbi:pyridoxamine 5'-phosphate oxidase family protein [Bradyrhizobium liaoningense]|uniref:MSMEG_1061 family FMN-dependent PPOX-type flavoprotein n=1 Tax=Bradyrhizobium liaoningense TaxID=43992 RepID=UPI001BAB2EEC|nr:MSMEG_1061 family FMN-dependent PPOX-type flavoprotein [Bradyrhizobium liaoningense]MBR0838877.1 pyridoxamine 5'-phosphate oxidase family protein [Bradyrhizobium liaoningense]
MTELASSGLNAIYPKPNPRVLAKAWSSLDKHAQRFIGMSPFCVIATTGADGSADASPRGGNPGFVHVEGPKLLLMPDRAGNNRLDSLRNIVEGSGFVHLLLFVPGIDEVLRINGKGVVTTDPMLLKRMIEFGKEPRAVLRVEVSETYFHCGKAAMRSRLWSDEARVKRSSFPSIGEINHDRTSLGEPESQAVVEAIYKEQL